MIKSPNTSLAVIVLAAGQGKRMRSELPKVLHKVGSKTMISRVIECASALSPEKLCVVVGHGEEMVKAELQNCSTVVTFALQKEQRGTGDATREGLLALGDFKGEVMILCGDAPLIRASTLKQLLASHLASKATATVMTTRLLNPGRYGRILRDEISGAIQGIKESADCSPKELLIQEINSGAYVIDSAFLKPALDQLNDSNAQGELYLTDVIERASKEGQVISGFSPDDPNELFGVNTPSELAALQRIEQRMRIDDLINSGVLFLDPSSTYVDESSVVESGVRIGANVEIHGKSVIKTGATVESNCVIKESSVDEDARVKSFCYLEKAHVGRGTAVGPFAHLRPGADLGPNVKIGNFVEIKKAKFEEGAKASHLSYIGDATVGANANIGAGTITCNYDGVSKHTTTIGEGAFVGSNTALIAPVTIGKNSVIGAGSAISKDVPDDSLAFTRPQQSVKIGWARRRRESNQ